MQPSLKILNKKAINSALNCNWEEAIELNTLILEKNENDDAAKIRLGRAYLKTKQFAKAKKIFKEILQKDPINKIAQKNYKLAEEKNSDNKSSNDKTTSSKALIKEPGTTTQVRITVKEKLLKDLESGDEVQLNSYKTKLNFIDSISKKELGNIQDNLAKLVYKAKQEGKQFKASVLKVNEEYVDILIKCNCSIFKSEKQQEIPFTRGLIEDEPEIELPEVEEEE